MKLEARFPKEENEMLEQLRSEVKEEIAQEIKDSPSTEITADEAEGTARVDESTNETIPAAQGLPADLSGSPDTNAFELTAQERDAAQSATEESHVVPQGDVASSQSGGFDPQEDGMSRTDAVADATSEVSNDKKSPTVQEEGRNPSIATYLELMLTPDAVPLAPPSVALRKGGSSNPHASLTEEDRSIILECTKEIRSLLQALQSTNSILPAASSLPREDNLLVVRLPFHCP